MVDREQLDRIIERAEDGDAPAAMVTRRYLEMIRDTLVLLETQQLLAIDALERVAGQAAVDRLMEARQ